MKNKLNLLALILIIILGSFLRIYNLSYSPPSLNWDEAAWGYNAYSVMQTGKDEYGKYLPIFTRSFDEYKSTLPMYLMIPSIKLFGLNEFGVRFPSALIGIFSILLIYLISKAIFKSETSALFAAFVFAIEPWSTHLARVYYDANEAMFFMLLGFLLLIKTKVHNFLFPFSILSFMISMFTYNSNKITVPLFLIFLYFSDKKLINSVSKKYKTQALLIASLFLSVFVYLAFLGQSFARVSTTNVFVLWPGEPFPKLYYFIWEVVGRYIGYFSPYNLFLREPLEPSTVVAQNSVFHPFEFLPWVIGLFILLRNTKTYSKLFTLLLVLPMPAMLTWNWFQPGRVMTLFAIYSILIGLGINKIISLFTKRLSYIAASILLIIGLLNAFYLFDSINVFLPYRDGGNYQPGFKETVPVVLSKMETFDHVIIDTPHAQPYIFYLFYGAYPPSKYHGELDLNYIGTPRKHFDFGKLQFRKIVWEEDKNLKNTLFVSNDLDESIPKIGVIKDKYGNTINELARSLN